MKNLILVIGLLSIGYGFTQDTVSAVSPIRHHLSVSYASNGQISDMVQTLYFEIPEQEKLEQSAFKLCAAYSFESKKGAEFGLQFGFGQRKDRYTRPDPTEESSQKYYSIMPFALKTWDFNRFSISTGGGIPLHVVSDYHFRGNDYMEKSFTATHKGGFAAGLNSISQVRFFLTERLALTSSVQFGWMHADLGGTLERTPDDPNYMPVWITKEDRTYKKSAFTQPEFFFGIGFRL